MPTYNFHCEICDTKFQQEIPEREGIYQAVTMIREKHRQVSLNCNELDKIRVLPMETENTELPITEHHAKALQKHPNPGDLIKVFKGTDGRTGSFFAWHKRVEIKNGSEVCVCIKSLDNDPEFKAIKFFLPEHRVVIVNK